MMPKVGNISKHTDDLKAVRKAMILMDLQFLSDYCGLPPIKIAKKTRRALSELFITAITEAKIRKQQQDLIDRLKKGGKA